MTDFEPFERELATLRPRDPSSGLRHRIEQRLAVETPNRLNHLIVAEWRGAGLVAGLFAASLVAGLFWRSDQRTIQPAPIAAPGERSVAARFDPSWPSVWSYHAALAQSSEQLDTLLDEHSHWGPERKRDAAAVFALARLDPNSEAFLGEL